MREVSRLWRWYIWMGCALPLVLIALLPVLPLKPAISLVQGLRWLPPVPYHSTAYSIADAGLTTDWVATNSYIGVGPCDFHTQCPIRLDAQGIVRSSKGFDDSASNLTRHQAKISLGADAGAPEYILYALRKGSFLLVRSRRHRYLYRDSRLIGTMKAGIRGYEWNGFWVPLALRMNSSGETVGNEEISFFVPPKSDPFPGHERTVPLLWRGGYTQPVDLNCFIPANSPWHLDGTLDINDRGQILCVARHTNEAGAEGYDPQVPYHIVVLTPIGQPAGNSCPFGPRCID